MSACVLLNASQRGAFESQWNPPPRSEKDRSAAQKECV